MSIAMTEFHMHLSNFPHRNWGVILQQAWSVYLKHRVSHRQDDSFYANKSPNNGNKRKEICKRFNKGKCNKGFRCQYDHRCLGCGRFGHGVHICRDKKNGNQPETAPVTSSSAASQVKSSSSQNK